MYCSPDSKNPDNWNPALSHTTLAIFWGRDKVQWGADVGLQPNQERPWESTLYVGDDYCVYCAMHKLGHVMGNEPSCSKLPRDALTNARHDT